jgi:hypothetical protein
VSRAGIAGTESVSPGVAAASGAGTGVVSDGVATAGAGVGVDAFVIATGVPIESETTGAFANGSFDLAAEDDWAFGAVCECESLTTGSFRTTRLCVADGTASGRCDVVAVVGCGALGSGASTCTFGTRRSGSGVFGSVNAGSASFVLGIDGCRSAAAIGTTYSDRSTTRPIPAHQ